MCAPEQRVSEAAACPFCGGVETSFRYQQQCVAIGCDNIRCFITGPFVSFHGKQDEALALKGWNQRAIGASQPAFAAPDKENIGAAIDYAAAELLRVAPMSHAITALDEARRLLGASTTDGAQQS